MEMKICEIISFAASLSIMWAEPVAEARRDLWAGVWLAGRRRAAAIPRWRHYPHAGGAERWARIPCHRHSYNYDK